MLVRKQSCVRASVSQLKYSSFLIPGTDQSPLMTSKRLLDFLHDIFTAGVDFNALVTPHNFDFNQSPPLKSMYRVKRSWTQILRENPAFRAS
jgi:hypothetical protein